MLTLSRERGVATLTIDRADKRNALSLAMWKQIPGLIGTIERDPEIRALIVTGRGETFAAGADIGEFDAAYATQGSAMAYLACMAAAQDAIMRCRKPTIAMIRGACIGAGCGLALSCDVRFADPSGRFAITPAKLGMIYTLADTKRLVDAVGLAVAHDLLLSGRSIDADEAARIGLVNRVISPEALELTTHGYALALCENAPTSLRGIKTILGLIRAGAVAETEESQALFLDALTKPDFAEGKAAFREKRRPRF
jgi:enoyl-CoA hydratase/carnithine racemase